MLLLLIIFVSMLLYHYGGIYLEADVEVLKSYNPLLSNKYIIGRELSGDMEATTIGAEKAAKWVYDCLSYYNDRHFVKRMEVSICGLFLS